MEQVLTKVRLLQYRKAMNLLCSPGLARQPLEEVLAKLQDLHPPEPIVPNPPQCPPLDHFTASTFDFITGRWLAAELNKYELLRLAQHWHKINGAGI